VLLFPGTKLEVVDHTPLGHGLVQIHLREVPVDTCMALSVDSLLAREHFHLHASVTGVIEPLSLVAHRQRFDIVASRASRVT